MSIGAFAGRRFSDLVRELFERHGVILLGISEDRRVVLHPGAGYIITDVRERETEKVPAAFRLVYFSTGNLQKVPVSKSYISQVSFV